jgi:hypothetical protein
MRAYPWFAIFLHPALKWMSENRHDCAALQRRKYGMAIRELASRWLNNGDYGLRSRFARNSKNY